MGSSKIEFEGANRFILYDVHQGSKSHGIFNGCVNDRNRVNMHNLNPYLAVL